LNIANEAIARNVTAALQLGNINFLCADIEWVEGLLNNYRVPGNTLRRYLKGYQQAAQEHLDESDDIVVRWLVELNETETQTETRIEG